MPLSLIGKKGSFKRHKNKGEVQQTVPSIEKKVGMSPNVVSKGTTSSIGTSVMKNAVIKSNSSIMSIMINHSPIKQ